MTGFFGGVQVLFYQLTRDGTLVRAEIEAFLPAHATPHVPTDLHQFQFEVLDLIVEIFKVSDDFRVPLCQQRYPKKFELSNVTGTSYEAGTPFLISSSVALILTGLI